MPDGVYFQFDASLDTITLGFALGRRIDFTETWSDMVLLLRTLQLKPMTAGIGAGFPPDNDDWTPYRAAYADLWAHPQLIGIAYRQDGDYRQMLAGWLRTWPAGYGPAGLTPSAIWRP